MLAAELYADSFFESSSKARFLTLVMVLDPLNPNRSVPESISNVVKQFHEQRRS